MKVLFFLVFSLLAMVMPSFADVPFAFATTPGQLPKTIRPLHYAIELTPDLATFSTEGTVTIEFEALQPVCEIILNALDLTVEKAVLLEDSEVVLTPKPDANKQTLTLPLEQELAKGKHRLLLTFHGKIGEQAQGLFYNKYQAPTGEKILLSTQMEATDARRMFPCWDEPVFRATFQLTVKVPAGQTAISNTPVAEEKPAGSGWKTVVFAPTPNMASYLVVLVVGDLEHLEAEQDGVKLRVYTTAGKVESARYALESMQKILHFYNEYFGTAYPLPKLDLVALPGGFDGAMENWGGITFNEATLLYDPAKSTQETKEGIFAVIAHEMAHQWFGDLVTMAWWDNLWLNEGFASWMGTKATDHFNPDWEAWLGANLDKNSAMQQDARRTTHPIQAPVANESEAMDNFDSITYLKGQAVIRMLEDYLGEEVFREGIRGYLKKHAYSSTTTADLWAALEAASGKKVTAVAAGWTQQPGFPVLLVSAKCDGEKRNIQLTQQRFTLNDLTAQPLNWKIPVALANGDAKTVTLLAQPTSQVALPGCNGLLLANEGDAGYFRIQYSDELATELRKNVTKLAPVDRLTFLGDTFALVKAGRNEPARWLDLVAALAPLEQNEIVWQQLLSGLSELDNLLLDRPEHAAFAQFAVRQLRPAFERVGWDAKPGESRPEKLLRNDLVRALADFGDEAIAREARVRFGKMVEAPASVPSDLRSALLYTAGRRADTATYDRLRKLARNADGTEEKHQFYTAMRAAADPELAQKTLEMTLGDEMPLLEKNRNVSSVASLGNHEALAWAYAKKNADALLEQVGAFGRNGYLGDVVATSTDPARADELIAFSSEKLPPEALAEARKAADGIRFRAEFKKAVLPGIMHWLDEHPEKSPSLPD